MWVLGYIGMVVILFQAVLTVGVMGYSAWKIHMRHAPLVDYLSLSLYLLGFALCTVAVGYLLARISPGASVLRFSVALLGLGAYVALGLALLARCWRLAGEEPAGGRSGSGHMTPL